MTGLAHISRSHIGQTTERQMTDAADSCIRLLHLQCASIIKTRNPVCYFKANTVPTEQASCEILGHGRGLASTMLRDAKNKNIFKIQVSKFVSLFKKAQQRILTQMHIHHLC